MSHKWLSATDSQTLLELLRRTGKTGSRKLLLFGIAACHRVQHLLTREYTRSCCHALDVWQRYANGLASNEELEVARCNAVACAIDAAAAIAHPGEAAFYAVRYAAEAVARVAETAAAAQAAAQAAAYEAVSRLGGDTLAAIAASWEGRLWERAKWKADEAALLGMPCYRTAYAAECAAQAAILRDIIANPFRSSPILEPSVLHWHGQHLPRLARQVYDDRLLPSGHLKADLLAVLADALEECGCTDVLLLEHLRSPGPHVRGCWGLDLCLAKG
jgi:hypothetical protein